MQMIIHDRKPTDGDREDVREFLEPVFDPLLPVTGPSPSKNARRTHRDTQWYQRVIVGSISRERAIVIEGVSRRMRVRNVHTPVRPSRSRSRNLPEYANQR